MAHSPFDALNPQSIKTAIERCLEKFPSFDGLLIAHGILPDQDSCESNFDEMRKAFDINLMSVVVVLNHLLPHFKRQGQGTITVISSVAGDRGVALCW